MRAYLRKMVAVAELTVVKVQTRAVLSQRRVAVALATLTFQLTWAVGVATVSEK